MKKCPQCNIEYFDNMLEFCLEDGVRLLNLSSGQPTATAANERSPVTEKTHFGPPPASAETIQFAANRQPDLKNDLAVKTAERAEKTEVEKGKLLLEIAPIVISLAHNWWQWIYLEDQYYSSFTQYVFSANFLMWLLLLLTGAAIGLYSLRKSPYKGFTYTALVILAVNLLLFIIPRR